MPTLRFAIDSRQARQGAQEWQRSLETVQRETRTTERDSARLQQRLDRFEEVGRRVRGSLTAILGGASFIVTARAGIGVLSQYESGLVGVGKTSDLSGEALARLGLRTRELRRDLRAVELGNLIQLQEAAGQLGVKGVDNLLRFGGTLAILERTTDVVGDKGARQIARLLEVTGDGVQTVDRFGDVLVRLGNNSAATEGEILFLATQVGQNVGVFGASATEAAALGATYASLGVRAELAGSATGRAFRTIDAAIRSGGDSAVVLEQVIGESVESIRQRIGRDAIGVFQDFVEGLGRIRDESGAGGVVDVLDELGLGGEELLRVLPTLANRSEVLARSLALARDEAERGGAASAEFANIQRTLAASFTNLRGEVGDLALQFSTSTGSLTDFVDVGASGVRLVASNLDDVARAAGVVGVAFGAIKGTEILRGAAAYVRLSGVVRQGNASIIAYQQSTVAAQRADIEKTESALARLAAERSIVPVQAEINRQQLAAAVASRQAAVQETQSALASAQANLTRARSLGTSTAASIARAEASRSVLAIESQLEQQRRSLAAAEVQLGAATRTSAQQSAVNEAARLQTLRQRELLQAELIRQNQALAASEVQLATAQRANTRSATLLATAGRGVRAAFSNVPFLLTSVGTAALFAGPLIDLLRDRLANLTPEQKRAEEATQAFIKTLSGIPTLFDQIGTGPSTDVTSKVVQQTLQELEKGRSELVRGSFTVPLGDDIEDGFEEILRRTERSSSDFAGETIERIQKSLDEGASSADLSSRILEFFEIDPNLLARLAREAESQVRAFDAIDVGGQTVRREGPTRRPLLDEIEKLIEEQSATPQTVDLSGLFEVSDLGLSQNRAFRDQFVDVTTELIDELTGGGGPFSKIREAIGEAFSPEEPRATLIDRLLGKGSEEDLRIANEQDRIDALGRAVIAFEQRTESLRSLDGLLLPADEFVRDAEQINEALASIGEQPIEFTRDSIVQGAGRAIQEQLEKEIDGLDDIGPAIASAILPGGFIADLVPEIRGADPKPLADAFRDLLSNEAILRGRREGLIDGVIESLDPDQILSALSLEPSRGLADPFLEFLQQAGRPFRRTLEQIREEAQDTSGSLEGLGDSADKAKGPFDGIIAAIEETQFAIREASGDVTEFDRILFSLRQGGQLPTAAEAFFSGKTIGEGIGNVAELFARLVQVRDLAAEIETIDPAKPTRDLVTVDSTIGQLQEEIALRGQTRRQLEIEFELKRRIEEIERSTNAPIDAENDTTNRDRLRDQLLLNQAVRDENAILDEVEGRLEEIAARRAAISRLEAAERISRGDADQLRLDLDIDEARLGTGPLAGLEEGLLRIQQTTGDTSDLIANSVTRAFSTAEDAVVRFVQTGEFGLESLASLAQEALARFAFRQGADLLSSVFDTSGGEGQGEEGADAAEDIGKELASGSATVVAASSAAAKILTAAGSAVAASMISGATTAAGILTGQSTGDAIANVVPFFFSLGASGASGGDPISNTTPFFFDPQFFGNVFGPRGVVESARGNVFDTRSGAATLSILAHRDGGIPGLPGLEGVPDFGRVEQLFQTPDGRINSLREQGALEGIFPLQHPGLPDGVRAVGTNMTLSVARDSSGRLGVVLPESLFIQEFRDGGVPGSEIPRLDPVLRVTSAAQAGPSVAVGSSRASFGSQGSNDASRDLDVFTQSLRAASAEITKARRLSGGKSPGFTSRQQNEPGFERMRRSTRG